ncbi:dUTP diphosphatase [Paludicola sp. MB14-C6]|uniref:dUTP diphosphatase n=1 Tax=Paludihabitans sp. MB14-C6 TaxID=3070656 RepID=UPI0027DD3992|nr:dUTP diphosphatase [Paludicola sp. MB14-C6]WMJ21813.1 dUTP diphosphatase [Paludicola sp. MB14-C6]
MKDLQIKRLRETATIPTRATAGSAGYDLYADIKEAITIAPNQTVKIPTGIAIGISSENVVALVYARSGLSTKHGITLANCVGVIDSDYRGEILVALINQSNESYTIQPNERVAQMVLFPIYLPQMNEVAELEDTVRGDGGFGSTSNNS